MIGYAVRRSARDVNVNGMTEDDRLNTLQHKTWGDLLTRLVYGGAALLLTGVSVWLLLTPKIPFVVNWFGAHTDKVIHFGLFGLLDASWTMGILSIFPTQKPTHALRWATLAVLFFATFTEFLQRFVPGRESSGLDLLANYLGIASTVAIFVISYALLEKRRTQE